jgi:hypothetical protein
MEAHAAKADTPREKGSHLVGEYKALVSCCDTSAIFDAKVFRCLLRKR